MDRASAPDLLPYVFDRFRQADSSTRAGNSATGLGLSIVKHLVEMHGGTVECRARAKDAARRLLSACLSGRADVSEPSTNQPRRMLQRPRILCRSCVWMGCGCW